MIYGLYLSAQGAQIQSLRQEVVANNLANAATTSFKRDLLRVQAHDPYDLAEGQSGQMPDKVRQMPGGVAPAGTVTDFSQGSLSRTGSAYDLAIAGPGFLRVANGDETFLTRDGQLTLDAQNQLVTRDQGFVVLGPTGTPLPTLNPNLPIEIRADGGVTQGGAEVARLGIVEPSSYDEIGKLGKNMYSTTGDLAPAGPETAVKQGFLESSGVQPTQAMMELIESSRAFEANINMIRFQDEALGRLLQSLPRK
jgi:flagellar basal-body rod protein FlgF